MRVAEEADVAGGGADAVRPDGPAHETIADSTMRLKTARPVKPIW